jgi:hypothetical protein
VKGGRKVGRKKRILGNKIFRIKRRKTNRVRNKYEDNMEISLDPPAELYLFNVSTFHFPTSYVSPFHHLPPIPPIPPPAPHSPPLSLSQDTPFVVSSHKLVI